MSSKNRDVQVRMLRIQSSDKQSTASHTNNVIVRTLTDSKTKSACLRIDVDEKTIVSKELNDFEWHDQSCSDGVATINSSSMRIVMLYDKNNQESRDFFAEMREYLRQKPSVPDDQTESAINDLVKSIEEGSSNEAEQSAKYLAHSRAKVQFNLTNPNDAEKNESKTKKSEAGASSNVLQLQLRVECHLNKKPLVATIYVLSGTDLRSLKEQIEAETGISRKDQYWYAFERYLISDDYEFGSGDPVVPPRKINAPKKQAPPPKDPVRSGDTLIMCIARIPPFR